ncbi:peptidylprolyl isomerase [Flavobacteriaceae bacterium Ap0902]|nr:peptidylprolyl isomerase [Flavobacteriaceae bacterium Ap0902]
MMRLKENKILPTLILMLIPIMGLSQEKKIDGVAAVVGNEVILESDIQRDYTLAQQQGMEAADRCAFVNNMLVQKMVLHHAKNDTLVSVSDERVRAQATQVLEDFKSRGSEEEILSVYGVKTMAELQNELEILVRDNQLIESKRGRIESDLDASPEEVKTFFNTYQSELPQMNEEVEMSHIVIHPTITEEHKEEIINRLLAMKQEIIEGASFSTKAILYSEDPGSKENGGLYENIKRGTFVPEFDAVAFNLDEGEISDPVETQFGFHLIQLERRRGQSIDVRHILISAEPTEQEMAEARNLIDSIRTQIKSGDLTFKEAAKQYSVDKYTRYNGGQLTNSQNGETKFERSKLPMKQVYAIAGLEPGDISEPFETEYDRKKAIEILRLDNIIPAHKLALDTDYTRIKNMTIQQKKQEKLFEWIDENMNDTFVKIHKDYQSCDFGFNWLKK